MSLMGVDVGTTGVKAVAFDLSGSVLASAYEEYPLLFPFEGAAELDSHRVVEAGLRVVGRVAETVRPSDPVRAIGIGSQGEAFTPIAVDGRFLAHGMTSSDTRARHLVGPWSERFGRERLYGITGHTPYPMYSLYKLLWLQQNDPEAWRATWKLLFMEDLLAYALTGDMATDHTMAARSMLFDVRAKAWSEPILQALDLAAELLPMPLPPGSTVGVLSPHRAEALGLARTVTVSVCGHDQPLGALGCGAAAAGLAAYSIGTTECLCPAIDRPVFGPGLMDSNLATYPHVVPDTYTTVAFNLTGGSVLRWVRDELATAEAADALGAGRDPYDAIIAAAATEPADLVLLPHFGPTGTPHFDPLGAGTLFGLQLSTTRAEVLRAVLEGITYEMKWNLAILSHAGFELSEIRAVGGGARSPAWMQIKADVLGVPLTTMQVTEGTCMGAAMLAGSSAGLVGLREAQASWARPVHTFAPDGTRTRRYEERFEVYKELYTSLGGARRLLHDLKGR